MQSIKHYIYQNWTADRPKVSAPDLLDPVEGELIVNLVFNLHTQQRMNIMKL